MAKKAVVSVINDLYTDQRVHKMCMYLTDRGYEVTLVGRRRKNSLEMPERPYQTKRMKLMFETGAKFYAVYNIRLFFLLLFRKADVLVSNDLDTLLANYLASKFKRNCRLVYDSHEYFTEVPELLNRPKVRNVWLKIEKWIFPKLKYVYTVNNSIAKIYSEKYNKDVKVVRNISKRWQPNNLKSKLELGLPENTPLIIMQGAGINVERGAEEAVEAMKSINGILLIVGDGDVVPQLKETAHNQNLGDKVWFIGKKPYDLMMNYTYHADLGLTLDKPTSLNYKFSLPNKVFDYMHTSTPIVATEIKEVAAVIRRNKIGVVLEDFSVDSLAKTINELIENPGKIAEFKSNCRKASEFEHWDKEVEVLNEIYPDVR